MHKEGSIAAVLDIDSSVPSRFTEEDREGLSEFVESLEKIIEFR